MDFVLPYPLLLFLKGSSLSSPQTSPVNPAIAARSTRDVKKLAEFGLVRVRRQNNLGHGIVQIVEPIVRKLVMRADI